MLTGRNFIALSFCVFLFLIVSVWALPNGRFVLVLTNPDRPPDYPLTVIANAGGAFVAQGRLPWMTVAHSEAPDFAARLAEAGALLVLNHQLAIGCMEGSSG
ncbi:hypothetical protein ACWGPT_07460 [Pseudorhizobium sp. NPDC055634]